MNIRCFHCGQAVPIMAEQLGGEVTCPSCGGVVRLPEADISGATRTMLGSILGSAWLGNSLSGLVSLALHMGLLLLLLWSPATIGGLEELMATRS
jgi:hypothetical protein